VKKIVVIGPESTGKSTLCKDLATCFQIKTVPEYARVYLESNGVEYTYQDVLNMIHGQLESERSFVEENRRNPFIIFDTNYITYKVWIQEKYKREEPIIEELLNIDDYTHYLLCDVDVPWTHDPLREHPNAKDRQRLFDAYKSIFVDNDLPFSVVKGTRRERLEIAKNIVNKL
tara:strand:- start:2463 stop:2981 length:519 start_codon:yes stop_codon:yes gene_type:complete